MLNYLFLSLAGASLSLALTITAAQDKVSSASYGGSAGTDFNDMDLLTAPAKLTSITFYGARRLDSLTLTLSTGQTFRHGGEGGERSFLNVAQDDYVKSVKLCWDEFRGSDRIYYAEAATKNGQTIKAGQEGSKCATVTASQDGYGVIGSFGKDGDVKGKNGIHELGFIFGKM
ncbi:hypothetical protein RSOLAG22IIIB_13750 [Rhizoctonia solani]|uniref:Jacalin-type lectin domain-containing protein n=1 Tax=Rhizoctonia solani TaxID=456999 RepID=A0A0K6FQV1_9AGAM|nr:hypothetical protein RSOLAG22IIIB_13750 [Rhizoctonia solani]